MLNQIILVEDTKFSAKLLNSIMLDNAVSCYNLEQIEDFTYLIDDLRPQIILTNIETVQNEWDLYWRSIESSSFKDVKIILYGDKDQLENCLYKNRFDQLIDKPLDILTIYEFLKSLVE